MAIKQVIQTDNFGTFDKRRMPKMFLDFIEKIDSEIGEFDDSEDICEMIGDAIREVVATPVKTRKGKDEDSDDTIPTGNEMHGSSLVDAA